MKKVQSLSKFKNNELKQESLAAIVGGQRMNTTWSSGAVTCDDFNSASQNSKGFYPAGDVTVLSGAPCA